MADVGGIMNLAALLGVGGANGTTPAAPDGALAGLFGGLVTDAGNGFTGAAPTVGFGVTADAEGVVEADLASLLKGLFGEDGTDLNALLAKLKPAEGEGLNITVSGDVTEIRQMVMKLTAVAQVLAENNITLDDLSESSDKLTNALVALGMDPEEAEGVAEGIIGSIKDAEAKLKLLMAGKTDEVMHDALADMLALLAAASATTALTPVSVTFTQAQSAPGMMKPVAARGAFAAPVQGIDLARELAGIGGDAAPAEKAAGVLPSLLVEGGEVTVHTGTLPADDKTAVELAVTPATPQPVAAQAPVAEPVVAQVMPKTGEKVAADKILDKPKGEVVHTLKGDDAAAVETVDAAPAAAKVVDGTASPHHAAGQVEGAGAAKDDATNMPSFAERMAQADRAAVARQAVVQMSQLAGNGGGHVRMQLTPVELGQLDIDLKIQDGVVTGSISATERAVVEHLARELQNLKQGLAEAGLKIGGDGLNLMLNAGGHNSANQFAGQQGQQAGGGTGGNFTGTAGADDLPADVLTSSAWINPDQLVDVRI